MNAGSSSVIYSRQVIEFVTVANEYCNFVERTEFADNSDFLGKSQKLLSLLYLKASMIPVTENREDAINEKFVTESDWNYIQNRISNILGNKDVFIKTEEATLHFGESTMSYSISEVFADIFQDLKDFLSLYRLGDEDLMNDGLWECKLNFEQYWGSKLLSTLMNIHLIIYSIEDEEDE